MNPAARVEEAEREATQDSEGDCAGAAGGVGTGVAFGGCDDFGGKATCSMWEGVCVGFGDDFSEQTLRRVFEVLRSC